MKMHQILKEYSEFRKNMGISIDEKIVYQFWDRKEVENIKDSNISIRRIENPYLEEKIRIAKNSIKYLRVLNWVKFIAISGSVASSFAKEEDDIDIFLVVKNDRAWIYRGLILFGNIFHKRVRMGDSGKNVKDKLCLNFITEERSLSMEADIFNLNEIISLIPIYKEEYFKILLKENTWLFTDFNISKNVIKDIETSGNKGKEGEIYKRYRFLSFVNYIFLLPQLFYMKILKHNPDYERLINNYRKGRIEFFPIDFKERKLNSLKEG